MNNIMNNICGINGLKSKEVINIHDGARLGFVSDAELDLEKGALVSVTVPGPYRFMGMFGKDNDYIIKWENIRKIGEDIILVDV